MHTKFIIVPGYAYEITFLQTKKFIESTINKYREKYDFIGEPIFTKPKIPWNQVLLEKGYPIYSKQFSVILHRAKNCKSKSNLIKNWIWGINTERYKIPFKRLFLLDDDMKNFNTNKDDHLIDDDYFNIDILKNKNYENFRQYYSEKCCNYVKGGLKHIKWPSFVGTMASESDLRKQSWIKYGCNILNDKKKISRPLSIWNEVDIWKYIIKNKTEINEMYGYSSIDFGDDYKDRDKIKKAIQNLRYKRLGCISCPYGAHLDEGKNRFEILYQESRLLYESQVIRNGMYKVLIDMGIKIKDDEKYMNLFNNRWKQIDNWYHDIEKNIFKVIVQIENYKNYKNYDISKTRNRNSSWIYDYKEIKDILIKLNIKNSKNQDFDIDEIKQIIDKLRIEKLEGNKQYV